MDRRNRKTTQEAPQNVLAWLLNFEEMAGQPIIISLLVDHGKIELQSLFTKKRYLEDFAIDNNDNDQPEGEVKEIFTQNNSLDYRHFIG
jgi:hypothetical protein